MAQPAITWRASETRIPTDPGRRDMMVVSQDPGPCKKASFSASAASTAALNCQLVEIVATTACHIAFDETATTDHTYLPANSIIYRYVPAPGTSYLSAIRFSNDGVIFVTECR